MQEPEAKAARRAHLLDRIAWAAANVTPFVFVFAVAYLVLSAEALNGARMTAFGCRIALWGCGAPAYTPAEYQARTCGPDCHAR